MKKNMKTVDWMIYVTALLDLIVFILILLVPSCSRREPAFVQPDVPASEAASDVSQAMEIGNSGDLKITLLWDFEGDIDLHVLQPNNKEIFFRRSSDNQTSGYLDVDNTKGGYGSAENIYWQSPMPGQYKVFLHYYQASTATKVTGSGTCRVVVFQQGHGTKTYSVDMSRVNDTKHVVTVSIR